VKVETYLFAGVALFFAVTAAGYGWFSEEPAGTAALVVAFLMSSLVAFFLAVQRRRRGIRPEDRRDGEVAERAGPVDFFPPRSPWPPVSALGFALAALGVVFGLWLFLIGFGVLAMGVAGFVFQYGGREG
jgi:Cytochrome c oxidase subunit IV